MQAGLFAKCLCSELPLIYQVPVMKYEKCSSQSNWLWQLPIAGCACQTSTSRMFTKLRSTSQYPILCRFNYYRLDEYFLTFSKKVLSVTMVIYEMSVKYWLNLRNYIGVWRKEIQKIRLYHSHDSKLPTWKLQIREDSFMAQQHKAGLSRLILDVCRSHTMTHPIQ
jgi:hypothetical protein